MKQLVQHTFPSKELILYKICRPYTTNPIIEFLSPGFLLVAEWSWFSLLAVIPVTHGYSKAKESAAPSYHISCYFILHILVWIYCWTNRQKENPINCGFRCLLYVKITIFSLLMFESGLFQKCLSVGGDFRTRCLHSDFELTFRRWFITELVASHGYLWKNSEMESQCVSFPEEHSKSFGFEFCKMSWHNLRK